MNKTLLTLLASFVTTAAFAQAAAPATPAVPATPPAVTAPAASPAPAQAAEAPAKKKAKAHKAEKKAKKGKRRSTDPCGGAEHAPHCQQKGRCQAAFLLGTLTAQTSIAAADPACLRSSNF